MTAPKLRLFGAAVERKMNIDPYRSFRQQVEQLVTNLELTETHVHDNCYDKLQGYRSPDKGSHAESSSKEVDGGKQKVYRNKSTDASNKHVLGAPSFD